MAEAGTPSLGAADLGARTNLEPALDPWPSNVLNDVFAEKSATSSGVH